MGLTRALTRRLTRKMTRGLATPVSGGGVQLDRLAIFGDSIPAGSGATANGRRYGDMLAADAYPSAWTLYNNAEAGETSAQMLARVLADTDHRRNILILHDRPNTGEAIDGAGGWVENHKEAAAHWLGPVIIVPPLQDEMGASIDNITDARARLLSDPVLSPLTFSSDLQAAFTTAMSPNGGAATLRPDTVHPNDAGNVVLYQFINAHMQMRGIRQRRPEMVSLISRFTSDPGVQVNAIYAAIQERIYGCGAWAVQDVFRFCAMHDEQARTLNWQGTGYTATKTGTVTHEAYAGSTGDGSTGYFSSGFNPGTAVSPKFQRDNAHVLIYPTSNVAESKNDLGASGTMLNARNADSTVTGRLNQTSATPMFTSITNSAVSVALVRENGSQVVPYRGGATLGAVSATSIAVANAVLLEGSGATGAFATKREGAFSIGGAMTATQMREFDYALRAGFRAVGLNA